MNFLMKFCEARRSVMVRVRALYVLMVLPLAAVSGGPGLTMRVSNPVAGRTLISAPVSMRN